MKSIHARYSQIDSRERELNQHYIIFRLEDNEFDLTIDSSIEIKPGEADAGEEDDMDEIDRQLGIDERI